MEFRVYDTWYHVALYHTVIDIASPHVSTIASYYNFTGMSEFQPHEEDHVAQTAAYCLLLTDPQLHLTPLLANKKFRGRGNKEGVIKAFEFLQKQGLGVLKESVAARGTSKVCN